MTTTDVETLHRCNLCGSSQLASLDGDRNFRRCETCGYVFDSPRPTAEAIKRFYSQPTKYDAWTRDEAARDVLWQRRLAKLARTRKPGSLLDVGTGIGQFLHHARAVYSDVVGTEVSSRAIEIARAKYGLTILEGPVEQIDFGGRRFDNITVFHVLEHVPDPRVLIERCRSLLADGGTLIVAVPNDVLSIRGHPAKLRALRDRVSAGPSAAAARIDLPKLTLDGSIDEIHLSHFTPHVLQRFIETSGFHVLENGLDPFYVADGLRKLREDFIYASCQLVHAVTRVNVYDTMWVAARKV